MSLVNLSASKFAEDKAVSVVYVNDSHSNETNLPALDNPVILRTVFSNINSTTTLKNIRSVSKFWRWESMKRLKNLAVLIINEETQNELVEAYIRNQIEQYKRKTGGENLKSFFHLISEKPFKNYKFPKYISGANLLKLPPSQPKAKFWETILWDQYFAFATYLDIDVTILIAGSCFTELKWLLRKCPCLKTLIINPHVVPSHDAYKAWHFSEQYSQGNEIARREPIILEREIEEEDTILAPNLECLSIAKSYYVVWQPSALLNQENAVWGFKQLLKWCPKLKHLWTQAGKDGSAQNSKILEAAIQTGHKLESLSLLALFRSESVDFSQLCRYILQVHPPLTILVLTMNWYDFQRSFVFENFFCGVKDTAKKLELYINCDKELPEGHRLRRGMEGRRDPHFGEINLCLNLTRRGRKFYALTDLKIIISYKTFNESPFRNYFNPIVCFDLRGLRNMQKLREFRYESGLNIAKPWVTYKTTAEELKISKTEDFSLSDLKHFYFHRGFTSEAIKFLGKCMPNLETFEAVLDQENFETVLNAWPKLKLITLLPWSDVPKAVYERTMTSVTIEDKSGDYKYRQTWRGSTSSLWEDPDKHDWRQLSCFKRKAHDYNVNNVDH